MKEVNLTIRYTVYPNASALPETDQQLLKQARQATANAYAHYSSFFVAAAALVKDRKTGKEQVITGTNQENASFPVGICAERVLLSAISSVAPNGEISAIAISYKNKRKDKHTGKAPKSDHPAMPCGMCRQALREQEMRQKKPFRLILSGQTGAVLVLQNATDLLPLSFSEDFLD